MAYKQIVAALPGVSIITEARREESLCIPDIGGYRFIESDPVLNVFAKVIKKDICIVQEPLNHLSVAKAALDLKGIRQIPVEHCRIRNYAVLFKESEQFPVISNAFRVDLSCSVRNDSRPRERESV